MILEAIQAYGFKLLMVVGAVFLAYLALQKYYEAETMGCWILKQEINRHGLTWKAVGRYHSPTDWRAAHYAWSGPARWAPARRSGACPSGAGQS